MRVLALERELPGISADEFSQFSEAEAHRVWELIQGDIIREIYFRRDENTAIIILECDHVQQARQILDTLPMVEAGLIDFDLIPLKPYPGLARLFHGSGEEDVS